MTTKQSAARKARDAPHRAVGRPPFAGVAGKRYQVRLTPEVADRIRRLGGGSLSRGIVAIVSDEWIMGVDRAMHAAARRARKEARKAGTPVYVQVGDKIVAEKP